MRKQEMTLKKAAAVFGMLFAPAFLLSGCGTLVTMQTFSGTEIPLAAVLEEMQAQPESSMAATALTQTGILGEAEQPLVDMTGAAVQSTTETVGEVIQPSAEVPGETVQLPADSLAEAVPAAEDAADLVQLQAESAENTVQQSPETVAEAEEAPAEEQMESMEVLSVTMIGDSVMLGASSSIQEALPNCVIDAKVSRQVVQADSVITSLEEQGALGQIVIMALGTNGTFSTAKGQALIDRLGSGRTIYWVTVYGRELSWQEDSNATIRALAANNENVHLIEWAQAAPGHGEWFGKDGIHLNGEGKKAYAGIILGSLFGQSGE